MGKAKAKAKAKGKGRLAGLLPSAFGLERGVSKGEGEGNREN